MTIDLFTLIIGSLLLAAALISPMLNPFFRRLHNVSPTPPHEMPGITVLLVSNGDHTALDEHLPIYLTQEYAPGYDVIVVTEKADAETENVLKRYSHDPRLYHTFVPESSRYMSKSKLAITLGVKASKHEWIVLTDPRCKPSNSHWVESLARWMSDDNHLVLGYANYSEESASYHRFEHLHQWLYLMREAQNGRTYRTNHLHVSFKKSDFMKHNGFVEYLKYSIGEYDFLVNKYGGASTQVATDKDTWLMENPISEKTWQNRQVYYREVGKHIDGGRWVTFLHGLDQWAMYLNYLLAIAGGVFAAFTSRWLLLGCAVAALVITVILRTLIGKKTLREYDVNIPSWRIVFLELQMLRRQILTRLRYEYADKNDFISHKV